MRDSPNAAALVCARGVTLRFGTTAVVADVDLDLHEGEIVTLIGPNGSGKTTLVRALLGLVPPSAGSVTRKAGLRLGYAPQHLTIGPSLPITVRRFLALAGGVTEAAMRGTLEEVGAAHTAGTAFQELSGGEARRVVLARALLRKPDLLVLDEPTAGVDVAGQADIYRLIQTIRDRHGCGVLLVSHDLHLVMAATDQVVCLNRHVCCSGRPEAVSRHPEYLALFGPLQAPALAVYAHLHDHHHGPSGEVVAHAHRE